MDYHNCMKEHDPLDLQGQAEAQETQKLSEERARLNELADLKWLMSSERGRRIVWRLLDRAGVFRTSFNTNALSMSFNEGRRNEGLVTLQMIHAVCPELYPTMIREASNGRSNSSDRNRSDSTNSGGF
jgi:hypothetical protein